MGGRAWSGPCRASLARSLDGAWATISWRRCSASAASAASAAWPRCIARAPALDRAVAVKALPAALAADSIYVRRFREEARWGAALHHPHIVPVYHYGEDAALLYLVMPLYRESLRDRLQHAQAHPQERLDPDEAIRLVGEIASALEAAHAAGAGAS
jgi:serine/threonine protein kinase